jgi:hypothetical protein
MASLLGLFQTVLCRGASGKTQMEMPASSNPGLAGRLLILTLLVILVSPSANAAESSGPVFVKAACLGKISSSVLSFFKEEIRTSQKYQLVPNLSDNGLMDVVLTVDMSCAEHSEVAGVATVYGKAKCFGVKNCHLSIDGSSLRSDLCGTDRATECGRALFKAFDDYMSNPLTHR